MLKDSVSLRQAVCDPESDSELKTGSDLRLQRLDECGRGFGGVLGFDASAPHVLQELIRDFCKNVFGQTGHAEDVIPSAIDVVSERNELRRNRRELGLAGDHFIESIWLVF